MPSGIYIHKKGYKRTFTAEWLSNMSLSKKGKQASEETKIKMRAAHAHNKTGETLNCLNCKKEFYKQKSHLIKPSGKKRKYCSLACSWSHYKGENHHLYKHGLTTTDPAQALRIWRRSKGKYYLKICLVQRISKTRDLTIETIKLVYEDNIKKYGTLTCYLCEKTIEFGKDSLEHKMPLSRGGSNLFENLGIAHRSCNSSKKNKTVEEYLTSKKRT